MRIRQAAHYENDDPAEIAMCLNCAKPRCDNCLDPYSPRKGSCYTVIDAALLARMSNAGKSIFEMAEAQGLSVESFRRRLHNYSISTINRPHLDRRYFENLSPGFRRYLTWEGEPMLL